ncbi:MAG: DnaA/Hda family protein [Candidatus Bipolaricaulota bacterium]
MIQGSPIGKRLEHCTFDNFNVDERNQEAYAACRRLAEEGRPGVLLMGRNGVGKTHLLVATMKSFEARRSTPRRAAGKPLSEERVRIPSAAEILQVAAENPDDGESDAAPALSTDEIARRIHVEYWPLLDLVSELRLEITRGQQELSRRCRECDLLALDDLGAERVTDFVLEELERIVDWRYRTLRPTAVATNLKSTTEIGAKYGQRALSRWAAACELVTVLGSDRRASMEPS